MSVTRILWVVFFLNAAVAATKLAFGYSIHSISLVADGFHSTTDAAMNIAGLAAIFIAARPPDANHPYGHKKVETLASLFVGVLLVFVAYQIVQLALDRWSSDAAPAVTDASMMAVAATMAVNAFVVIFEGRAGRRLRSDFLEADAAQTRGDLGVSASVLVSLWAVRAGYPDVDLLVAAIIAAAIVLSGIQIFRRSVAVLVDEIAVDTRTLSHAIHGIAEIRSIRRIRTRGRQDQVFVDIEVAVDPAMTVEAAHCIANRVEGLLKRIDSRIADVVVHVEPEER